MKYTIVRTDTADISIRKIVTFIARNFGEDIALKKLNDLLLHGILGRYEDNHTLRELTFCIIPCEGS